MKSKVIILLVVSAVVTLSFTFTSRKAAAPKAEVATVDASGPAGGMISEDPIK